MTRLSHRRMRSWLTSAPTVCMRDDDVFHVQELRKEGNRARVSNLQHSVSIQVAYSCNAALLLQIVQEDAAEHRHHAISGSSAPVVDLVQPWLVRPAGLPQALGPSQCLLGSPCPTYALELGEPRLTTSGYRQAELKSEIWTR